MPLIMRNAHLWLKVTILVLLGATARVVGEFTQSSRTVRVEYVEWQGGETTPASAVREVREQRGTKVRHESSTSLQRTGADAGDVQPSTLKKDALAGDVSMVRTTLEKLETMYAEYGLEGLYERGFGRHLVTPLGFGLLDLDGFASEHNRNVHWSEDYESAMQRLGRVNSSMPEVRDLGVVLFELPVLAFRRQGRLEVITGMDTGYGARSVESTAEHYLLKAGKDIRSLDGVARLRAMEGARGVHDAYERCKRSSWDLVWRQRELSLVPVESAREVVAFAVREGKAYIVMQGEDLELERLLREAESADEALRASVESALRR